MIRKVVLRTNFRNFSVFRLKGINVFVTITKVICLFLFSGQLLPSTHPSATIPSRRVRRKRGLRQIRTILKTHFPNVGGGLDSFGFRHRCKTRMGRVGAHDKRQFMAGLGRIILHRKSALIMVTSSAFVPA